MSQAQIDKLAADFQKVEHILDRAKSDLMDLVTESENQDASVADDTMRHEKSRFSWLTFRPGKSDAP